MLTVSEMVPLLPTQPLALTSGILFGSFEGALIIWAGNVAAATISFLLAGVGADRLTLFTHVIRAVEIPTTDDSRCGGPCNQSDTR